MTLASLELSESEEERAAQFAGRVERGMLPYRELDYIQLKEALPEHHLPAGSVGMVLEVPDPSKDAYLVKFRDDFGRILVELMLKAEQMEFVCAFFEDDALYYQKTGKQTP